MNLCKDCMARAKAAMAEGKYGIVVCAACSAANPSDGPDMDAQRIKAVDIVTEWPGYAAIGFDPTAEFCKCEIFGNRAAKIAFADSCLRALMADPQCDDQDRHNAQVLIDLLQNSFGYTSREAGAKQ